MLWLSKSLIGISRLYTRSYPSAGLKTKINTNISISEFIIKFDEKNESVALKSRVTRWDGSICEALYSIQVYYQGLQIVS